MLRPHRGSRARLITGAQYVDHALPAFMNARASRPIAAPVAFQSVRLKAIAVVMGKAKLVSYGVVASLRTWLMPCVASDHQLYGRSSSDGIAGVSVSRAPIFSLRLMRPSMSATRESIASVASHQGSFDWADEALRQGL